MIGNDTLNTIFVFMIIGMLSVVAVVGYGLYRFITWLL
jgi:nitrate reductase NapE component